jgi:putative ABC transport system permease protein
LTFQLTLPAAKYQGLPKSWSFYKELLEKLRNMPGIRGAAISSGIPMGAGNYSTTPAIPLGTSALPPGTALPLEWRSVSPEFFRTMRIPLLRGRVFSDHDGLDAQQVMIVSQQTAQKYWGTGDPLGRVVRFIGSGKEFTVVGVVGDVRSTSLNQVPNTSAYLSVGARIWNLMDVVVRTEGKPEAALGGVRQKVHELDRDLPISTVRTMDEWVSTSAAQPKLNAVLLAVFAVVALLIAAIGVYGVLSYSVTQRTREIGLRMALGARQGNVLRMVVREGMMVGAVGIGAGLLGALLMSRLLASLLYGVEVRDLSTFAVVAGVLAVVALIACYMPARRASRVDPVVALREE